MSNSTTIARFDEQERNYVRTFSLISYGLIAYAIGVAGLAICIFAYAGIIPLGFMGNLNLPTSGAIVVNIALLIFFGLQHSVLARPSTKQFLNRYIPAALERSNYVWTSGAVLAMVVAFWQPIEGQIWALESNAAYLALAGLGFGWAYLLAATFAINHWDLFGLRQVWLEAMNVEYSPVSFKEHWMYRYSRHPIMLGVLIGIWCLPEMSATTFMLSVGLSVYIVIGLYFEERDLIRQWGSSYLEYKKRVGMFFSVKKP